MQHSYAKEIVARKKRFVLFSILKRIIIQSMALNVDGWMYDCLHVWLLELMVVCAAVSKCATGLAWVVLFLDQMPLNPLHHQSADILAFGYNKKSHVKVLIILGVCTSTLYVHRMTILEVVFKLKCSGSSCNNITLECYNVFVACR